jgi:hypothetical protein
VPDDEGFSPEDTTYGAMMEASVAESSESLLMPGGPRALELLEEALHDRESSFVNLFGATNPRFLPKCIVVEGDGALELLPPFVAHHIAKSFVPRGLETLHELLETKRLDGNKGGPSILVELVRCLVFLNSSLCL